MLRLSLSLFLLLLTVSMGYTQRTRIRTATKPAAATESISVPEYFGLYLSNAGRLCGLDVDVNPCIMSVPTRLGSVSPGGAFSGKIVSTSEIKAVPMTARSQFIIYSEKASAISGVMKLVPLMFVRKVRVNTGWPENITRNDVENAWDSNVPSIMGGELGKLNEAVAPIQLLSKPLRDKMLLAAPSRPLTAGLYKLSFGQQVFGNEPKIFFWVGDAKEAEVAKCVDASHQLTGFQTSIEYKPCDGQPMEEGTERTTEVSPKPLANPDAGRKTGQVTLAELMAIEKQASTASIQGDRATAADLLDDSFVYTDLDTRKKMDKQTFLQKLKANKSIKSFDCYGHKLTFEGEVAVVSGTCHYVFKTLFLESRVSQKFTDRFKKDVNGWRFVAAETSTVR